MANRKQQKIKNWVKKEIRNLKEFIGTALSHHPPCRCYRNHVLTASKLRICAGCLFAGVGIILGIFLFAPVYFAFNNALLLVLFAGALMLASFFWMKFSKSSSPVHHRAVRKFMLGFGLPLYYYTSFAVHWVFVAAFVASIPVYAYVSMEHHKAVERRCRHRFKAAEVQN